MTKANFYFILAASISFFGAFLAFGAQAQDQNMEFSASIAKSKSALKSEWKAGDSVSLFYQGSDNTVRRCTATAQSDGKTTIFRTDVPVDCAPRKYVAVYPSSRNCSFPDSTKLDITDLVVDYNTPQMPATLDGATVYAAQSLTSSNELVFQPVCAVVKFECNNPDMMFASIFNEGRTYSVALGAKGTQYMAMPPAEIKTVNIRLNDIHGSTLPALTKNFSKPLEAGIVYDLGDVVKQLAKNVVKAPSFRLMSFNILRGDLEGLSRLWEVRKKACLKMISSDHPDIIGLQECNSTQRQDILDANPRFGAVGISVDGKTYTHKASSNPIFYDGSKFLLEDWGTFWLSPTPDIVSNTWHYRKPRTATWAKLKQKGTNKHLLYVCVHLQDNSSSIKKTYADRKAKTGSDNRQKSAALIVEKIKEINTSSYPVLISGDMNTRFDAVDIGPFRENFSLVADIATYSDKGFTFNGYKASGKLRIDHMFSDKCIHNNFSVERSSYEGVRFISDHWPIFTDMKL